MRKGADKIQNFVLNGAKNDKKGLLQMMTCLNDPRWLHTMGGALFMAGVKDEIVHLNLAPAIIEGHRTYHHDMPLDSSIKEVIVGMIDANGQFRLLVKLESPQLPEELKEVYQHTFNSFAQFMVANGLEGRGPLDTVSELALNELKLFDFDPRDLSDIAEIAT